MAVPDKKDRRRPLELLSFSVLLGVFVFFVVLMGTRDPLISIEFAGVAFIVGLVVLAMLALAARPEGAEKADLAEQDHEGEGPRGH